MRRAIARYALGVSPFRDAPPIELGPLDVGLPNAATRAIAALPRGGRVLVVRRKATGRRSSHTLGAVGSAGVLAFVIAAAAAWATGWRPANVLELALLAVGIVIGGASLAAVLSALDRDVSAATRRGEVVGREATLILRRLTRIALLVRRGRMVPGGEGALRRAIAQAADPDVARWIPRDVRGRAELLLARTIAATGGRRITPAARAEVRDLLRAAAEHLDQPAPAEADLAVLDRASLRVAEPRRFAEEPAELPAIAEDARRSMRLG